jgi:hypothetical protein
MSKAPSKKSDKRESELTAASTPKSAGAGVRVFLLRTLGQFAAAPIIGMLAGFLLLVGGIFLAIAWTTGPQPLIDSFHYAPYTAHTTGRIVDSWVAVDFDPSLLPKGRTNWQPYSKVSPCVVVEYSGDWGAALRRAFCGNRSQFREDFRLDDWHTMAPGVPFSFLRDANGFSVEEIRVSKTALDWLGANPPDDTFMMSKPPPTTTLAALKEQFDRPTDVATASWTHPFPAFLLTYDPKLPDQAMPAAFAEERQRGFWWGGLVFTLLLAIPGILVWRVGINILTGQTGLILWLLTLAPMLALPWWSDVLPQIVRRANKDWAEIVTDMLDDIHRVTRFTSSTPSDALLADGERIVWHVESGAYLESFGRIRFAMPQPAPASVKDAMDALRNQISVQVRKMDSDQQAALFARLRQQNDAALDKVQSVFWTAAEETLRDGNSSDAAHTAARDFLIFSSGGHYAEDELDKIETAPR